jgi:tRNA(Ile)-lysidine synthetase-like protein
LETMARSAALSAGIADFLGRESVRAFEAIAESPEPGTVCLSAGRLAELHPAMRALVLRQSIRSCRGSLAGVTSEHVRALERLCTCGLSGHSLDLAGGLTARLEFDLLWLRRVPGPEVGAYCHVLPVPGECSAGEAGLEFRAYFGARPATPAPPPEGFCLAYLDRARVGESLLVRSRRPGDRYGGPGHRKVKRMLINARIPLMMRVLRPMVVSGDAVVWIPGFAPARQFRAQPGETQCVVVEARVPEQQ